MKGSKDYMSFFAVDREKCARDGLCVSECPARIIRIRDRDDFPALVEGGEELCINCGHCVAICPHGALSLRSMTPEQCPPVQPGLLPAYGQIDHFLRSRRSIRSYKDELVDRTTLTRLIRTARYGPTGHNLQPVHWLVIEEKSEVHRLAGLVVDWMRSLIELQDPLARAMHFDRLVEAWDDGLDRVLRGAPHLIVAHADASLRASQPACIIALTYLELAIYAERLAACWAGYFNAAANSYEPMQEALALPTGHQSFGALMVGHPKYAYHRVPLRSEPRIEWR
jgi:nitroreductase/NAD-dependent dihydropyrimidine dehydrogenase PreA subunit